ncbi:MAG TPA: SDR family NAD(P)-dependent oxidoreductase [Symbiobacteriaceae bacterium]
MKESERIALVTGANRGIGFEIARLLAERGIHTILTSRDPRRGAEATAALASRGLPVSYCPLDVADAAGVQAAVEAQF